MKIQYISDIHVSNTRAFPVINKESDIIAVLGDIGDPKTKRYSEFLNYLSQKFKIVLLIAGNHEFYGTTIPDGITHLKKLISQFPNIEFLNNNSVFIEGVLFVGTTLWSNITNEDSININDYRYIKNFTPNDSRELHFEARNYIRKILQHPFEKVVILSHHAPHKAFNGGYTTNLSAFSTDMTEFMADPLKAWLCGHTHINLEMGVNGVKLASNCLGYPFERTINRFNGSKTVEI